MFDVLVTNHDDVPYIPIVSYSPSMGAWDVYSDGEIVARCKSETRAAELCFSIVSAAVNFRARANGWV
jgi:hypothetical protein